MSKTTKQLWSEINKNANDLRVDEHWCYGCPFSYWEYPEDSDMIKGSCSHPYKWNDCYEYHPFVNHLNRPTNCPLTWRYRNE